MIRNICKFLIISIMLAGCAGAQRGRNMPRKRGIPKGSAEIIKLMEQGNFEQAAFQMEKFLNRPRAEFKDSLATMRSLAICYTALEQWVNAKSAYDWLAKNDSDSRAYWEELSRVVGEPEKELLLEHLPNAVNSIDGEIMPVISPDGRTLYFIVDKAGDQDIYVSKLDDAGNWSQRQQIGAPLNTAMSDGILSTMPDGNTVLLNGVYDADGTKDAGYSLSHNLGDKWSFPEKVEIKGYYNKNRFTSACLASDGKTLILALECDDGYGDLDLYVCFRDEDGTFSKPQNLGPTINSHAVDGTPFLAPDGVTLYFSSDGHPSLGNADMFFSRRQDSTWTNWSFPKNLGKELNTVGWDAYYTIPATGDYVYFVSSAKDALGGTDIFRVKLPKEAQPKPVVTIEGTVKDTENNFVGADIRYERLSDGKNLGIASSNPMTGYYSILLPVGEKYGFSIQKPGYLFHSDNVDLTDVAEFSNMKVDIQLKPVKTGAQIVLKNIFFDFNSSELLAESIGELNRLKKVMQENPEIKVEIAGHTDSVGTDSYNQKLSQERAQAVVNWLVESNVDKTRLIAKGYGRSKPVADNSTEDGRAQNRRVTFTVLETKKP